MVAIMCQDIYTSWLEIILCEIQNACMFIFFALTLFVIAWNGGWMVYALACHHGSEWFLILLTLSKF
jgi:hypothetical protein